MSGFRAVNPATGEALDPEFASSTASDVDRLARHAAAAFASYKGTSGKTKAAFLRAIAANLEANGGAIAARANLETALPLPRLQGELARTCGQLRLFAALVEEGSWVAARIDHGDPNRKPAPRPDLRSMLRPLGPVAVFGASNFPLAFSVAGGDTASALAAGCPVVVKAHPAHPGTSRLAADAIANAVRESNLPEGLFGIIFESGVDAGVALVRHPAIKAVAFTGSRRGGDALAHAVAQRAEPIPLYAEMGSINPVFILPDAMRERGAAIAAGLHASVTLGVGQFCTNPGVVVAERVSGDFIRDLESRIRATPPEPMLTQGICDAYRAGVAALARTPGVVERAGHAVAAGDEQRHGSVSRAALFTTDAATFLGNDALMSEVFGPSTLLVDCTDREQLLDVARRLEGQLTVTVHATYDDVRAHRDLLAVLETKAGRIVFNGFPTGVEVAHAIVHGGPYPATSDGRSTSVGTRAIERFTRPVCWQDAPEPALPDELKESNPLAIRRMVDGAFA